MGSDTSGFELQLRDALVEVRSSCHRADALSFTLVTFGIRPEHVLQMPAANGSATAIEAAIVRVDPLGAETIVIARLPGVEKLVFARFACDAIFPIGERRQLFLDLGMAHVFGGDGLALRPA